MRHLFILALMLLFTGCYETHNKMLSTGEKPPMFFHTSSKASMDRFEFNTERFYFKFPSSRVSDFTERGGWSGMSHRDGNTIAFSLKDGVGYHISISTSYSPSKYGESDRAIENRDLAYLEMIKKKYNYPSSTKLYYETHGQENYGCRVNERIDKFNRYKMAFNCRKFNSQKTKSKSVVIVLTYSKPINPILAKEYTYEDLKQRAKRMLDSLYITDKW